MIFFDLDGTLMDFKAAELLGVQAFQQHYGNRYDYNCSQEDFYDAWCRIGQKHYSRFLSGELTFEQQQVERMKELVSKEINDEEAAACYQTYIQHFEMHWQPYEDVIPCLHKLAGRRLGVITNGDSNQQRLKLERMGLTDYFEMVITSGELGYSKPDAAIFHYARERAGTDLHEMIYVGDDVRTDIVPCEALGIKGIWLNRRNESPAAPVKYKITTLNDLFEYLSS
ncbi:HAD family hydrolase [Paenibacillus sp. UNC451MF]|uniref:HAD family hydrolase n=1 Tax=Paenibacillus sp. UNC451MF TaxID=1449063 RepID=UPI000490CDD2|nr:HAD family hydrolase [Paenibacillus sp. UNC451MF]